ncbi:MAG: MBL fold metallo-hydrolase, partial [Planctomycetota bacterium]
MTSSHLNRRRFCLSLGALAAGVGWPRRVVSAQDKATTSRKPSPEWPFVFAPIGEDAWAVTDGGANALLVKTADRPLLVDTKLVMHGDTFLQACRETAGDFPAVVINTHHHGDHTGGNWAFREHAQIIGHQNLRNHIPATMSRYTRGMTRLIASVNRPGREAELDAAKALAERVRAMTPKDFEPTLDVGDRHELTCGDEPVVLHHFGAGHTDNDLVVHLPRRNVLHVGDLVFEDLHPFVDMQAGVSIITWQRALAQATALCDASTVVIPGHGNVTNWSGLRKQTAYFQELIRVVEAAIDEGQTRAEIVQARPPAFDRL